MIELVRTNDPVLVSWLVSALAEAEIDAHVFDAHTSILEGSAAAIPRRIMVHQEDYHRARCILHEAEAVGRAR